MTSAFRIETVMVTTEITEAVVVTTAVEEVVVVVVVTAVRTTEAVTTDENRRSFICSFYCLKISFVESTMLTNVKLSTLVLVTSKFTLISFLLRPDGFHVFHLVLHLRTRSSRNFHIFEKTSYIFCFSRNRIQNDQRYHISRNPQWQDPYYLPHFWPPCLPPPEKAGLRPRSLQLVQEGQETNGPRYRPCPTPQGR